MPAWIQRFNAAFDRLENRIPLFRVLALAVLAAVAFGAYRLYVYEFPTPYQAPKFGFKVYFPGQPIINTLPTQKVSKQGSETGRIFTYETNSGATYDIYAVNYSSFSASSLTPAQQGSQLSADVSTIANTESATIKSPTLTTFKGQAALRASLLAAQHSTPIYLLAFLHNNHSYILMATHVTTQQFNHFTSSFQFLP